jgi:hypothetical protein
MLLAFPREAFYGRIARGALRRREAGGFGNEFLQSCG